jgi:HSP20 family molecular chaperone IbpA
MFEILFPSRYSFDSSESRKHEKDLLDLAAGMLEMPKPPASFPKHNLFRMLDGNPYTYFMEFALAGYDKSALDVKMDNGYLVVSGKTDSGKKEEREYIHQGMARRDFSTRYFVGKNVEVKNAKFNSGLLVVELEKLVPDEQRPRSIEIY